MQPNKVKARLKEGKAVAGPIIGEMRTIGPVRVMALAGFDFLFLDMEHGMANWETTSSLVQMSLVCDICPIVRPTDLTYADVARAMDSGAQGVIIPRVENREQAEAAVSYVKYPPLGRRGAGGDGRNGYERLDARQSVETSNRESMVVLQIESTNGIANLDEIASVAGVDVLLIGPQDLSISLGVHGNFSDPVFMDAAGKVAAAGKRHGVATGMGERAAADFKRWYDLGMRFLVCNSDGNMLRQAATNDVNVIAEFAG